MKLKRAVPLGILIVLALSGLNQWLDKPYCTLELLESYTPKSKRNMLVYSISKITVQRRELQGNDPYRLFLFVHDPDGLKSVSLTVDGKPVRLDKTPDDRTVQQEIPGIAEFGMHHYVLAVSDKKGNTAKAEAWVKVTASGGGFAPVL